MIRILMLTCNSSLLDGINRHILTVAPALNRMEGFETAVCTVHPVGELNMELEKLGVHTYSLGFNNGHAAGIFAAYRQVLKDFRPDVVHSHVMALCVRIVHSFTSAKSIPVVSTTHGIADTIAHPTLRSRLESILLRVTPINEAYHLYISRGVKEALYKESDIPSAVCYNPIDFSNAPTPSNRLHELLNLAPTVPVIGTACRIAAVKQPERFTEVMSLVLSMRKDVHACVMGDGDTAIIARCKAIVENYGVADRFHWLGYRADAPRLVAELSCFILTSACEGMPTAALECFAGRTPLAMLEGGGGLTDLMKINDASGPVALISPAGNNKELAEKIADIIDNPSKAMAMAENAFTVGQKYFDIGSVARHLAEVYTSVIH